MSESGISIPYFVYVSNNPGAFPVNAELRFE
jgi:hypothetical protein